MLYLLMRKNDEKRLSEAKGFKTIFDAEWRYLINSAFQKRKHVQDLNKVTIIPETQDLVKLRKYLIEEMRDATDYMRQDPDPATFQWLAKVVMCRLLLFNKRRVAEVEDLTVEAFLKRPAWKDCEEFEKALTPTERQLAKRQVYLSF